MSRIISSVFAIVLTLQALTASASTAHGTYAAVRSALASSVVPVLLPMPIPRVMEPVESIAVIRSGPAGYYVGFSPVAHCAGALSCAFFHVAGLAPGTRIDLDDGRDRSIRLADGTRGVFRPADCSGASCTEASLLFQRRGWAYEIDAKVNGDALWALESVYMKLRVLR